MTGAAYIADGGGVERITLDGALSTTSGTSPITSTAITVTVPPSNSGTLAFSSVLTDSVTPQYKKNSGSFTNITEGLTVVFANGDTITVRATLPISGNTATFNVTDNDTGHLLEAVSLVKT